MKSECPKVLEYDSHPTLVKMHDRFDNLAGQQSAIKIKEAILLVVYVRLDQLLLRCLLLQIEVKQIHLFWLCTPLNAVNIVFTHEPYLELAVNL